MSKKGILGKLVAQSKVAECEYFVCKGGLVAADSSDTDSLSSPSKPPKKKASAQNSQSSTPLTASVFAPQSTLDGLNSSTNPFADEHCSFVS